MPIVGFQSIKNHNYLTWQILTDYFSSINYLNFSYVLRAQKKTCNLHVWFLKYVVILIFLKEIVA